MAKVSDKFGLIFNPEGWSNIDKFTKFVGPPFSGKRDLTKGIASLT